MIVKLLTEHHLEFLSLKGGCTGSSKSTLVKMSHCWKSHALAQLCKELIGCNFVLTIMFTFDMLNINYILSAIKFPC